MSDDNITVRGPNANVYTTSERKAFQDGYKIGHAVAKSEMEAVLKKANLEGYYEGYNEGFGK